MPFETCSLLSNLSSLSDDAGFEPFSCVVGCFVIARVQVVIFLSECCQVNLCTWRIQVHLKMPPQLRILDLPLFGNDVLEFAALMLN